MLAATSGVPVDRLQTTMFYIHGSKHFLSIIQNMLPNIFHPCSGTCSPSNNPDILHPGSRMFPMHCSTKVSIGVRKCSPSIPHKIRHPYYMMFSMHGSNYSPSTFSDDLHQLFLLYAIPVPRCSPCMAPRLLPCSRKFSRHCSKYSFSMFQAVLHAWFQIFSINVLR